MEFCLISRFRLRRTFWLNSACFIDFLKALRAVLVTGIIVKLKLKSKKSKLKDQCHPEDPPNRRGREDPVGQETKRTGFLTQGQARRIDSNLM
ncbi:hypothetical protein CO181_02045 [candidate division WWE3 bacterium CG_4_9_14_3_um_filter_43_9]|uniref:Uncharacterized protein n=2 Tax=Katanobacteria TaxID=422282 RepID=A0A2M7WXR1_UNCKA|nr:MAG: hypothetical protein CO181_02045 [candidate division WWE3 bacterium CG_4_9_14_3_um_filter_43_9]